MGLRDRLARLEGRGGRCDNCGDWSPRIVAQDWRTNLPVEPAVPERCPVCFRAPTTVRIEEVDDWHGQRRVRPA
jgi:hypothetical protein